MQAVIPINGEPTRFWVQSSSLVCQSCEKTFSRLQSKNAKLIPGDPCPRCGGKLKTRYHLVDIACFWPLGQCSCEHWSFRLKGEIEALPPSAFGKLTQREADKLRCSHIEAARTCALNIAIRSHELSQTKGKQYCGA